MTTLLRTFADRNYGKWVGIFEIFRGFQNRDILKGKRPPHRFDQWSNPLYIVISLYGDCESHVFPHYGFARISSSSDSTRLTNAWVWPMPIDPASENVLPTKLSGSQSGFCQ